MKTSNISNIIFAAIAMLLISFSTTAQEYLLNSETNGTTITTCSGTIYDSGGIDGDYQELEEYIVTFCTDNPNNRLRINFTSFATENGMDYLILYDGPDINAPLLIAIENSEIVGQTITTQFGSCITFKFVSDGSVQGAGFSAEISCIPNCQNYTIDINSTNPTIITPESYENMFCSGSSVLFSSTGTFPNNNQNYLQSDENLTWNWKINKINYPSLSVSEVGLNEFEYTFESDGLYSISLEAIDNNGCMAIAPQVFNFNVPLQPDLSNVILEDGVCLGESIFLSNSITYDTITYEVTPSIYEHICMSDEYTQQWQNMNFQVQSATPGQTISSVNDLEMICITMEHSYVGDLDIVVECPNGQTANLIDYLNGCGGIYFGEPIDDDAQPCVPGIGYEYCFSMSALNTISEICEGYASTIPEGFYFPETSFSELIGCPIDGTWTVKFMDNLGLDDGIIFSTSLFFADAIITNDTTIVLTNSADLSPESPDIFWSGLGVEPNHGVTTVTPEESGDYDFTLSITDSYGCSSENVFTVTVYELNDPFCGQFCNSMVYETSTDTINDGSDEYPSQNNSTCDWLISQTSKLNTDIFFYWNYFDVYEGDVLRIYAGNSDSDPLLFEFSGNNEIPESFVIPGNEAFITYTTDGTLRSPGWELVYQTVPTGLTGNKISDISVFPNPVSDIVSISGMSSSATVSIVDMSGRIVICQNDFENSSIDLSNLESGLYFIQISGHENYSYKIVKQ